MIKTNSFVLADKIIRDPETNSVSILNVVEEFSSHIFPYVYPNLDFILLWTRESNDPIELEVEFKISMGTNTLLTRNYTINFNDKLKMRTRFIISKLVIPSPGTMTFIITSQLNKMINASYEVKVIKLDTEPDSEIIKETPEV